MLKLPDVTLVSVHNIAHELTNKALADCLKHASFGDVKIFTEKEIGDRDFAQFSNYEMPKYIQTSHVLNFQWDGWIINPGMWTDEFLKYDYIGAPWWYSDGFNVGNSGFCLRSKRLLDHLTKNRDEFPIKQPEDDTLCRHYRKRLPQFKWAPEPLARRFSMERKIVPFLSPFGFHGIFNWPFILTDEEIDQRLDNAPEYIWSKPEFSQMKEARRRLQDGEPLQF